MKWTRKPIDPAAPTSPYAHVLWQRHNGQRPTASGEERGRYGRGASAITGYISVATAGGCQVTCRHGPTMPDEWCGCDELRRHAMPMMLRDDVFPNGKAEKGAPPGDPPKAGAVFIGVIDYGTGFAHERFRGRAGDGWRTRLDLLWLQGAPADGRVDFGRILHRDEIDRLLDEFARGDAVDEDALYRAGKAGAVDMARPEMQALAFARSHGTAVLDLAAPCGQAGPEDTADYPLLVVDLPSEVVRDTLGTFVEHYIAAGIWRMIDHVEAREAQQGSGHTYPIVINISFALSAGSKDGSGLLEAVMQAAQARRRGKAPLRFVLPAGNHRQSRANGRLSLAPGCEAGTTLCLPPDDRTPSFVEFWGPPQAHGRGWPFTIRLTLPGGARTPWLPAEQAEDGTYFELDPRRSPLRAYVDFVRPDRSKGPGRQRITVVFPPTLPDDLGEDYVDPGDYGIAVGMLAGERPMTVDVHVQRDDTLPGFRRRGRQSVLVDPLYRERDPLGRMYLEDAGNRSTITRVGTINALANGATPLVVGGRNEKRREDAFYSGLGPDGVPPVHAISERGDVTAGIPAGGTRSGKRVAVSGTSFAAPQVAREEAMALRRNPDAAPLAWRSADDW